ncbi:hypothetical protein F5Y11DRAFT_328949 [Daldinia sp. FL1419]|nr:hypothetical protein F5Y11DRAFT_328949 [Daldinia sp. FL1419]
MQVIRLCEERGARWDRWGFVVYKSPEITDGTRWTSCKQRFLRIIEESVDPYRGYPGLEDCVRKMEFQWVEDATEGDGSVEALSRVYSSGAAPPGLNHSLCLYITPASMDSILNSPFPSSAKRRYRTSIPFAVAVSKDSTHRNYGPVDGDIVRAAWRGYFNVAVETLLDSLFPIAADGSMSPFEIGRHISGDDIWCDYTRWGVHKASVGYWDARMGRVGTGI